MTKARNMNPYKTAKKALAATLAFMLMCWNLPFAFAESAPVAPALIAQSVKIPPAPQPKGGVKLGSKEVHVFTPTLNFSSDPTDLEITSVAILQEPLIPMSGPAQAGENQALVKAIKEFKTKEDLEDLSAFERFLSAYPKSRWKPSLETNMGEMRYLTGYPSVALSLWRSAWAESKRETTQPQQTVASHAAGDLLMLDSRIGDMEELKQLFEEIKGHPFYGSDEQKVNSAQQNYRAMNSSPDKSFCCGPYALMNVQNAVKKTQQFDPVFKKAASTKVGTNLAQLESWANEAGLKYRAAKRAKGAPVLIPSVIHWSVSHFGALLSKAGDKYVLQDPTFGTESHRNLSQKAIDAESDGYFLISSAVTLPQGWSYISNEEAKRVWGKGVPNTSNGGATSPCHPHPCLIPALFCGCENNGGGPQIKCGGMTQPSAQSLQGTLNLVDTPLSYMPPVGPNMDFYLNYIHLQTDQPSTFTFTNLGQNWNFNWLSYLTIDPTTSDATLRLKGGGTEIFAFSGGSYPTPSLVSQAVLAGAGTSFTRTLPDGSVQTFNQADTATPKHIFMTQQKDPLGNTVSITYDAHFRITAITDSLGQVSTVAYKSNTVGNVGYYKIASITDPFSRSCSFNYDSTTIFLTTITDVIGIVSSFAYDNGSSFVSQLRTPYGTSAFYQYIPGVDIATGSGKPAQGLKCVFPDGSSTVVESWLGELKTTFFWDRHATELYPEEPNNADPTTYTHAEKQEWTYNIAKVWTEPTPQNQNHPLESSKIFYTYAGQFNGAPDYVGSINKPSSVSRTIGTPIAVGNFSGSKTTGDKIKFQAVGRAILPDYTVLAGDTLTTIATNLAASINGNAGMQTEGVKAVASGTTVTVHSDSALVTTYAMSSTDSTGSVPGTEVVKLLSPSQQTGNITVGGTLTVGDTCRITVYTPQPWHGFVNFDHLVAGGDTLTSIATDLVSKINADTMLPQFQCTASNVQAAGASPVINLTSWNPDVQAYDVNILGAGGTETLTRSEIRNCTVQLTSSVYNSIGKITQSIDPAGRKMNYVYAGNNIDLLQALETQGAHNFQIGAWTYNSAHLPLTATDGSGRVTQYSYLNYTNQVRTITDANSNVTTFTYPQTTTATVGGTISNNHLQTITIFDAALPGGQQAATFTEHTGDTTTTIAAGLVASVNGNANLQTAGITASNAANVITITSTSANLTTYTKAVTGTITITLGTTKYGYLVKIDGPLAGSQDVTTFTYDGFGRVYTIQDSEGYTLTYSYDAANRPTQTLYPDGTTEQTIWSNLDPVLKTDRIGRSMQRSYDVMGQLKFEVDGLGRKTQFVWCTCGSAVTMTDPAGHVTSWQHDLQGRTTKKIYQDTTFTTYSYDSVIGRMVSSTDAISQTKNYSYYQDDTAYQTSYVGAINPTSVISRVWDPYYMRLASLQNDWGTISYTYNPYILPGGAATTGGGRLQLVQNSAITNSDTTYLYDNLGRTTNRSINSTANSDTWTYDAMSRLTSESNTLGSFGYAYVDDVSGSSKGTTRLASVTYPNSQVTNYSWYPVSNELRLQQISNRKSASGSTISQYGQVYDSAGQMTQWQQLQGNNSLAYNFAYDQVGRLVSSQAGSGGPNNAYLKQNYFAYDSASNRTGSQQNTVDRIAIGGTVTAGNTLTVTVNNAGLTGGTQAVNYTVVSGDTLPSIATNMAAAMTANSNLQTAGINATSNGAVVSVRSSTPNLSTYVGSTSGGATETISVGVTGNFVENAVVAGTKTTSDTLTITVIDPALAGGKTDITYVVLAGDTIATIATGLKNAINANAGLTTAGISASVVGTVLTIKSTSLNATTYAQSISAGATETVALSVNQNGPQTISLAGTKTTGNVITTTFYDAALPGGSQAIAYTVLVGDTLTSIATAIASAINGNTNLQNIGVSASSATTVVTVSSNSINPTICRSTVNSGGTEAVLVNIPANGTETAYIGGAKTTGDVLTTTVYDAGLATGSQAVSYTVMAGDTLTSIAAGVAAVINGNTNLTAIGVTATSSSQVVNIKSTSVYLTTYTQLVTGTETITLAPSSSATLYGYNNINELTSIATGGPILFQANTNKALKSATVAGNAALLNWSQSFSGNATLNSGANTVAVTATDAVPNVKSNNYQIVVKGPASATPTYDGNGNMTSDGTNSFTWDAENRLTNITYPGTNNFSQFTYDGFSGLVKIVETVAGSVTSTKQFVRCSSRICEERNASSALVKQFFALGQTIGASNYFYSRDHLGSIREMTDSSGNIQAQYEYGMWGEPTQTVGTLSADFGYAGYYVHGPSGLNLTTYRAYKPTLGRWINRDPLEENGGINLFAYTGNRPNMFTDPSGLVVSDHNFDQDLVKKLEEMCCKCYKDAKDVANCKARAKALGRDLQDIWNRNYGNPNNPFDNYPDNAGGFMCYDWAAAFGRIIGSGSMLGGTIRRMDAPQSGGTIPQHYAITITAGKGGPECTAYIDDGYLNDGTVHGSDWDTGDYKDTGKNQFDPRLPHIPGSQGPF